MLDVDLSTVYLLSHATGAFAFAVLGVLLALGRGGGWSRRALILAAIAQFGWAAAATATARYPELAAYVEYALPARSLVIAGTVVMLLWLEGARLQARALCIVLSIVGVGWAFEYAYFLADAGAPRPWMFFLQVVVPIIGLMALENWFRNTDPDQRWVVKFAVIGLGLIFAYDLVSYLAASITGMIDPNFVAARGVVDAIAVPLIIVTTARRQDWSTALHVSRQAAFYSASVVACGGVFLVAAAGGHYVRNAGGTLGSFVQIVGSAAVAVAAIVLLASGSMRSRLKRVIEQNFFSYKYDYRVEWTRFISTIGSQEGFASLPTRVVRAIADVLDSPGGVLWLLTSDRRSYGAAAAWHVYGRLAPLSSDTPFIAALREMRGVAVLDDSLTSTSGPEREVLGVFWAVVPVRHSAVSGFVTLLPPRAVRSLSWEDKDLLHIVAQQAASYLAEESASRGLLEAQQLEEFGQRFAFVAHDLKNLISQLQLLVRNAERHRDNPDFQRDLLSTLSNSVEKMKKLLEQLHPQPPALTPVEDGSALDLAEVAAEIALRWASARVGYNRMEDQAPVMVRADGERLHTALDHLVQNALDAAGPGGQVSVSVFGRGHEGCIVVTDDGLGMDEAFVRAELFRPFRSTKSSGYGIGAYQARELVKSMGGSLEVRSAPGAGTEMIVSLVCVEPNAAVGRILER